MLDDDEIALDGGHWEVRGGIRHWVQDVPPAPARAAGRPKGTGRKIGEKWAGLPACSRCHAAPGDACRRPNGHTAADVHQERMPEPRCMTCNEPMPRQTTWPVCVDCRHKARVEHPCPDCGAIVAGRRWRCDPCHRAAARRAQQGTCEVCGGVTADKRSKRCLGCREYGGAAA